MHLKCSNQNSQHYEQWNYSGFFLLFDSLLPLFLPPPPPPLARVFFHRVIGVIAYAHTHLYPHGETRAVFFLFLKFTFVYCLLLLAACYMTRWYWCAYYGNVLWFWCRSLWVKYNKYNLLQREDYGFDDFTHLYSLSFLFFLSSQGCFCIRVRICGRTKRQT